MRVVKKGARQPGPKVEDVIGHVELTLASVRV